MRRVISCILMFVLTGSQSLCALHSHAADDSHDAGSHSARPHFHLHGSHSHRTHSHGNEKNESSKSTLPGFGNESPPWHDDTPFYCADLISVSRPDVCCQEVDKGSPGSTHCLSAVHQPLTCPVPIGRAAVARHGSIARSPIADRCLIIRC